MLKDGEESSLIEGEMKVNDTEMGEEFWAYWENHLTSHNPRAWMLEYFAGGELLWSNAQRPQLITEGGQQKSPGKSNQSNSKP